MITKFKEYNEGFFYSDMDKYVKKTFKEIKDNFDYSNLKYLYHTNRFHYDNDGIKINIKKYGLKKYLLIVDGIITDVSFPIKYKMFNFFKKKYDNKEKEEEKEIKRKNKEELKDKLDPIRRNASKYNL